MHCKMHHLNYYATTDRYCLKCEVSGKQFSRFFPDVRCLFATFTTFSRQMSNSLVHFQISGDQQSARGSIMTSATARWVWIGHRCRSQSIPTRQQVQPGSRHAVAICVQTPISGHAEQTFLANLSPRSRTWFLLQQGMKRPVPCWVQMVRLIDTRDRCLVSLPGPVTGRMDREWIHTWHSRIW